MNETLRRIYDTVHVIIWLLMFNWVLFGLVKYGNGPADWWFHAVMVTVAMAWIISMFILIDRLFAWMQNSNDD